MGSAHAPHSGLMPATPSELGAALSLWTLVPFIGLLLAIAVLPLFAPRWWEHNRNKGIVAILFALPVATYLLAAHGGAGATILLEKCEEYFSFIALLAALYVISGGIHVSGLAEQLLAAISCGAVFMGANSYIGNGPNFMVKAIAEENGIRMPSFFGYMLYSIGILIPLFGFVTWLFFR